jgi:hypothetical protein
MSLSASGWMGAKFRPDLACQIAIHQPSKSGTVTFHFNLSAASERLFKRGIQPPAGQGSYLQFISIISV